MDRKKFLTLFVATSVCITTFPSKIVERVNSIMGNFQFVYLNKQLNKRFLNFLKNVFHLFPDDKLHTLIHNNTIKYKTDKEIYLKTQKSLDTITPSFSLLKYQLPALLKQKDQMAKQTLQLIGTKDAYNGYLEIGSLGRYLDYLEEKVKITGERYYANGKKPNYSISQIIDRGQITFGATYIPMSNYKTKYNTVIPENSLDLVTVYIGFHHCPIHLRIQFISSIRDIMRPGGKLVLRDHDCSSEEQTRIVALAHDVFNMGTNEAWETNHKEVRNFYSLDFICDFVENLGFKFQEKKIYQAGDPTKNALMLFTKV